jgi:hypothetical protein
MDPDYIAFRELLRRAETDPVLAVELYRLIGELAPLREILALDGRVILVKAWGKKPATAT